MRILDTRVYRGPNLYHYRPMIRMEIDLEELEDYPSDRLPGFTDKLLELMPQLWDHHCSYGEHGGFVKRLREGTWMGHIIEHIAIELTCLAGVNVNRGKTRSTPTTGRYYVCYEHKEESVGLRAGELAVDVCRWLLAQTDLKLPSAMSGDDVTRFSYQDQLDALIRLAKDKALGPSTAGLVAAAEARDIPYIRLNEASLVQFGQGKYQKRIEATVTSQTSHIAVEIASDKELTIQLLRDAGLPVPRNILVHTEEEALDAADRIGYPVVTKPYDGNHGRGVMLNLRTPAEVREGFKIANEESSAILVEKFVTGRDYRILVVNGEVVAVAERVPGHIVGDGVHNVRELVDIVNSDPRRGIGHEKVLTKLEVDEQALWCLQKLGYTLDTIPPDGEIVYLRLTGNLSTGGTAVDRTDVIDYENIQMAQRAIAIIGLDIGGVDFICPDISRPYTDVGGAIVEINAGPGFRMHLAPSEGYPRDVAGKVIDMLFPKGTPSRVPVAAITATNGKTTTTRMVAHIMKMAGRVVGMTTTDGIYIDGDRILKGDMTGPWSARVVMRDARVDTAVLETARGGIAREGLGFDRCDVGAVLNVASDHLGLRGINTLEELADMKQVVIEAVHRDGWAVLNADNEYCVAMDRYVDGYTCWFSLNPDNPLVREHVRKGGRAAVLEKGVNGEMLTLYDDGRHIPLLWSHLIPATYEGHARFNSANALAAAAIAYCMNATVEQIRSGLVSFAMTFSNTPGRMNVFDEYPFRVIMDYCHNAPAMTELAEFVRSVNIEGRRTVVIGAPGDRRDVDIHDFARLAARTFDTFIIREDWDRRGRSEREVADFIKQVLIAEGCPEQTITVITDEFDAIRHALDHGHRDDLIVVLADDVTGSWKLITKYRRPDVYRRWLEEQGITVSADQPVGWREALS
ncbi:MAG: cyanophycin synthetase [Anaerolineae bacterium]|nr:cyanophycin synthetase [Anaerolineae bacterium]